MDPTRKGTGAADLVSGYSHAFAIAFSILGLAVLVLSAVRRATAWHVVGFSIFGASLILLYTASTLYHLLPLRDVHREVLRRLDHIMIYVLIAGTYTPVCLTLRGGWGWSIFGTVWGLAALGFTFKLVWLKAPRALSTALYVVMGWIAVVAFVPLTETFPLAGIGWLLLGGAFYTVGALFYATKWPTLHRRHFTFHELFHVLTMAGSLSHFWFMYRYVLPSTI